MQTKILQHPVAEIVTINRNWDFKGSDTRYSTHRIHTYLAAMVPKLAERLVHNVVPKNGKILDPFCGGGAVAVEGVLGGIPTYGIDINPLSIIISKAKTTYIEKDILTKVKSEIIKNLDLKKSKEIIFPPGSKIEYWYKPYMLKPLSALKNQIDLHKEEPVSTFLQCVFSGTCRDVALTYRNEQRLRRLEPKDFERFNPDVINTFMKRYDVAMDRVSSLPKGAKAKIQHGNILDLPFKNSEFTTIICSPPYGDERNGVPYNQFSKNMLIWLGYKREDLLALKKLTLGGKKQEHSSFSSPYLENMIDSFSNDIAKFEAISFYNDYFKAIKEMSRVTSDKIVIVIGNRTLNGKLIDNGKITEDFFEANGGQLIEKHARDLPHKRLPKMGANFGAQINKEEILIFKNTK